MMQNCYVSRADLALNSGRKFFYKIHRAILIVLPKPSPYPTEPSPPRRLEILWSHVCWASFSEMAFRSRAGPILRSSLSAVRTAVTRRTLTSQSKEGASSFRFAGPLFIGASAATAGLFAATQLYKNNFSLIGNVHAATKVQHLDKYFLRFQR